MTLALALLPCTEFTAYLNLCIRYIHTTPMYSMEDDAKKFTAMFGARPLWG
jgi:hypothetical protein